jgi:glycosyltransferase involved in cell wall biosynthesis
MFAYASSIVAVSKAMQQRLVEIGCPPKKIEYNPCGPDDLFFEITPEYTGKKFIGIGRFVDKKAPYYTILAFHQVLQRHPDAQLVIGGDGPLQNTCKNLVAYLGIQAQVQLPGVLTILARNIILDMLLDHAKNTTFIFDYNPLVSILLCTYNRARYLPDCIESVINQTNQDWELVNMDDGSTDDTFQIMDAFMQKHPNIRYLKHQNKKVACARNLAIMAS